MAASDRAAGQEASTAGPGIAVTDANGTVTAWSPAAERLLGHPAADMVGRSVLPLLGTGPDGDGAPASGLEGILREGVDWSGFLQARHLDGRRVPLHVRLSPLSRNAKIQGADGNQGNDGSEGTEGTGGTDHWLLTATGLTPPQESRSMIDSVLAALMHRSPMAIGIWDTDLRLLWMNDTAATGTERAYADQVGRHVTEMPEGFDAPGLITTMRRVLTRGVPVIDHEYPWRSADGKRRRSYAVSFFRLDAEDGRPMAVCTLAVDISRSWARRRIRLLDEASTRIGTTLDVMRTAQELADLSVPVLADYVAVDLAENVPLHKDPPQDADEFGIPAFRRAGLASVRKGVPESPWARGETVYVPTSSPFTEVLTTEKSFFEPHMGDSPGSWLERDPGRARTARESGMHSLMVVPLMARGDALGVAVFIRTSNPRPFDREDLVLAEELVLRASISLDNARQYTRERAAAIALQSNLLPRTLDGGGVVEVATRYLPAHVDDAVGGDWFDVFQLDGGRVALVVGDVVGHGLPAAAAMGQLRTAIRTLAHQNLPPAELLTRLDVLALRLVEGDTGREWPQPMNATCLYAVYDPATRRCTMARAGHPPPALLSPDGEAVHLELPAGTPIGVGLGAFESVDLALPEGAVLALYTDGLVETREADIDTGLDRLRGALARQSPPLDELCGRVIDIMVGDRLTEDDIALLLARVRLPGTELPGTVAHRPARFSRR